MRTVSSLSTTVLETGVRRYAYGLGFTPLQVEVAGVVYDVHVDHLGTPKLTTARLRTLRGSLIRLRSGYYGCREGLR